MKQGTPDPRGFPEATPDDGGNLPLVHQKLKREVVNGYSLVYIWQGTRADLEPVMLMAHQDVVSADPSDWTHPPFDGVIADGLIWGHGTLDIKNQLIGILEAAETLLQQGYRPERTILFGMGHDEETGGVHGSKVMGELLKERGVHLAGIVDEGGGISDGLVAGVHDAWWGVVGVSEKGYLTIEFYVVNGRPAHSSTPPAQTDHRYPGLCPAPSRKPPYAHPYAPLTSTLPRSGGGAAPLPHLQIAFTNIWLFRPLLKRWLVP